MDLARLNFRITYAWVFKVCTLHLQGCFVRLGLLFFKLLNVLARVDVFLQKFISFMSYVRELCVSKIHNKIDLSFFCTKMKLENSIIGLSVSSWITTPSVFYILHIVKLTPQKMN